MELAEMGMLAMILKFLVFLVVATFCIAVTIAIVLGLLAFFVDIFLDKKSKHELREWFMNKFRKG